jgi:hypothetical protein
MLPVPCYRGCHEFHLNYQQFSGTIFVLIFCINFFKIVQNCLSNQIYFSICITFVYAQAMLFIFLHGSFYSITIMVPMLSRRNSLQEGLKIIICVFKCEDLKLLLL